jgi:hypothetical protein
MMTHRLFDTLEYHRAHSEISTDAYVTARRVELGKGISKKRKIYLDTRFWILLRDVTLNRDDSADLRKLLETLREGVSSGALICPICETTFFEIFKQSDPRTRRATVVLVDELSTGVTLDNHWERAGTEISYLLNIVTGRTNLHDLDHLVWNKLSFVLGVMHPTNTPFDENDERRVQKAFFDNMWCCPLLEIEERLGGRSTLTMDLDGIAQRLNEANAAHVHECRSFEKVYREELMGGIENSIQAAVKEMEKWFQKETGTEQCFEPSFAKKTENMLLSIFSHAIKHNDFRRMLRTAHIGALCHASFRWDKKRKLNRTFRTPSSKAPWIFLPSYPSRGCRVKQLGGTCRAARNASWMAVSGLAKRRSPPTQRMRMPRNFQVTM